MNHVGVIVVLSKEQRGQTFGLQGPPIEGAVKFMGRVVARDMKRAEAAGERLRAAGYETHLCWDVVDVYSGIVFMEIFKDFTFAGDDLDPHHMLPIMAEINEIVGPCCADCIEASTVPRDYIPHSDEETLGAIYPRLVEQA